MVQGAGYRGGDELNQAFDYFRDPTNFSSLETMKVDQKAGKIKVSEVVNGYTAFGFKNEASQLSAFLRGIGERETLAEGQTEAVFTP